MKSGFLLLDPTQVGFVERSRLPADAKEPDVAKALVKFVTRACNRSSYNKKRDGQ